MKLVNLNVGIKIDNTKQIAAFLQEQAADIVAIQEIALHLEPGVLPEYQSKAELGALLNKQYAYDFFGPLLVANGFKSGTEILRDFGGHIMQGNQLLSRYPFVAATNEFYYKHFEYMIDWSNWRQEDHGRAVQVAEFDIDGTHLQVLNLHGIWNESRMGDERTMAQCRYVLEAAKRKDMPTIITGDFNLRPHSPSITILEREFKNLITEFGITTTRPDFKDEIDEGGSVVDYMFVSDHIQVKRFEVVKTDISDHLPLVLDFEIS
jgi:endonuclease/exonuclease/phosphatase family metal-dependent hydrolase